MKRRIGILIEKVNKTTSSKINTPQRIYICTCLYVCWDVISISHTQQTAGREQQHRAAAGIERSFAPSLLLLWTFFCLFFITAIHQILQPSLSFELLLDLDLLIYIIYGIAIWIWKFLESCWKLFDTIRYFSFFVISTAFSLTSMLSII